MNQTQTSPKRNIARAAILSIVINGVLPLVGYILLTPYMSDVAALTVVAFIPVLDNVITFAKDRHFDVFGLFMLSGLILSILIVLLGGDKKFLLVKESFLTGALGLVMLGSLLLPRPILYYFAAHFTGGSDAESQAKFAAQWAIPYFRFIMYLMTIVWGLALVGEAVIRIALVMTIDSTETYLAISPIIQYGILGATIAWTVWYARHAKRRGAELRREREAREGLAVPQSRETAQLQEIKAR